MPGNDTLIWRHRDVLTQPYRSAGFADTANSVGAGVLH